MPCTMERPNPVPLPTPLVEKRLHGARERGLVHAFAAVADRDADVVARGAGFDLEATMSRADTLREPPVGDRVAGVNGEV